LRLRVALAGCGNRQCGIREGGEEGNACRGQVEGADGDIHTYIRARAHACVPTPHNHPQPRTSPPALIRYRTRFIHNSSRPVVERRGPACGAVARSGLKQGRRGRAGGTQDKPNQTDPLCTIDRRRWWSTQSHRQYRAAWQRARGLRERSTAAHGTHRAFASRVVDVRTRGLCLGRKGS